MDQPSHGRGGDCMVTSDGEPFGQQFAVCRSPFGQGQRERLVFRFGLHYGRCVRTGSESPDSQ